MCGPADFSSLSLCSLRVAALAAGGGGLYAALRIARLLSDLRRAREESEPSPARERETPCPEA